MRNQQTIPLYNGSALEKNDAVQTRANSRLQMTFEDKTVITLGSDSAFSIQEYLNDAQTPKAKFKFNQGTFKSITGHIGKQAPQNFILETKTATIGIRGTTVIGRIGIGNNPDTIGCLTGAIVVSNAQGIVTITAGTLTTVGIWTQPTPPAAIDPIQFQGFLGDVMGMGGSQPPVQTVLGNGGIGASPITPPLALEAAFSSLQTATANNVVTQMTDAQNASSGNGFYPTFNPPLQASSSASGVVTLNGFTTSQYTSDGVTFFSNTDTLSLTINSDNDSVISSGDTLSQIILDRAIASTDISLVKSSDAATMTYKGLNKFSIKDFDGYEGWIMTEETYANDYVSWGYWALKKNDDSILQATTNTWVAGKDADLAHSYVFSLINSDGTTSYSYNGHVIGSVNDGTTSHAIDPTTNNAVALNFDFGGGSALLRDTSSIQFQTSQTTPQTWNIRPSGSVSGGTFSIDSATVTVDDLTTNNGTTSLKGSFYGDSAQAVGGTFKSTVGANTATGVFKAVRE
jgi:hypothetical protein